MRRALLAGVGALSTAGGLTLLFTPLSAPVSLPLVPVLGLVGVAGLGVGTLVAMTRSATQVRTGAFDDRSSAEAVRTPGDAFDERLASLSVRADEAERAAVRERLTSAAAHVLAELEHCSRSAARDRVAAGEWPPDDDVRSFFTGEPPSLRERAVTVVTGEPTFSRRARRVAAVLAERRTGA